MENTYWLRICSKDVSDKNVLVENLLQYSRWLIDNALEHGFLIDHNVPGGNNFTASLILRAMVSAEIISGFQPYSFYHDLLSEHHSLREQINKGIIPNLRFGFSDDYTYSYAYLHFVTREIDTSKYVDRGYQLVSPEWEDEHEKSVCIETYISKRAEDLENNRDKAMKEFIDISLNDKYIIEGLASKCYGVPGITTFECLVDVIQQRHQKGLSWAVLEGIMQIYEKSLDAI